MVLYAALNVSKFVFWKANVLCDGNRFESFGPLCHSVKQQIAGETILSMSKPSPWMEMAGCSSRI